MDSSSNAILLSSLNASSEERAAWIASNNVCGRLILVSRVGDQWMSRYEWCVENLGPELARWVSYGPDFYIRDERDVTLYRLAFGEDGVEALTAK
jgi:hypothetical protein